MNILISVNKSYLDKALTMLFSLRRAVREEITVYLLNHSLSPEDIRSSEAYLRTACAMTLRCIDVRFTAFDRMPLGHAQFSIEMYYRIFAQFLLPQSVDRALWLDADIIVLKDLSAFYHQDFEEKKIVAAPDYAVNHRPQWLAHKRRLGLPETYVYFNSGVLLMDLDRLRRETTQEGIVEAARALQDRLVLPDQDILNVLYKGDVKYADWKVYNYQCSQTNRLDARDLPDIAILHYISAHKPWKYWCVNADSRHYWRIRVRQGHWREAARAYWRQMKELTYVYLKSMGELLRP